MASRPAKSEAVVPRTDGRRPVSLGVTTITNYYREARVSTTPPLKLAALAYQLLKRGDQHI